MKLLTKMGLVIIILVIIFLAYFSLKSESPEPETFNEKVDGWLSSDQGQVLLNGEVVPVTLFAPSNDPFYVNLYDEKGNIIAVISMDKLTEAIEQGHPIIVEESEIFNFTPPPPAPTPVPVPIPVPSPITNQTNTTLAPTPTQPNVTPSPGPYIPQCSDSLWNGDESDLDCGGICAPCLITGIYTACWTNGDCQTNNCDLSQAQPLPAQDPNSPTIYNDYPSLRILAGQSWIIPYQGICK